MVSSAFAEALERGAPLDALIKILCLPIMIAYDSEILAAEYRHDYQAALANEVSTLADSLLADLPTHFEEVRIHIFLIPIASLDDLRRQFSELVGLT